MRRLPALGVFALRMTIWAVLVTVVLLLAVLVVVPRVTGSVALTVRSGSMAPAIPPGSIVVVRPVDVDRLAVGDVITYQLRAGEASLVSHRIVGIRSIDGERVFWTRGDANDAVDRRPVSGAQIRGAVWYDVPWVGGLTGRLAPHQRGLLVRTVAVALVVYGAWLIATALMGASRRRSLGSLAVVAAVLAVGAVDAAPAAAAGELELSTDGEHWSDRVPGPIIPAGARLVPSRAVGGSVHLRNVTAEDAELSLAVVTRSGPHPGSAAPVVDVSVWDGTARSGGDTVALTAPGEVHALDADDVLQGGEERRIDVALSLPADASNVAQATPMAFDLRITLAGDTVDVPGGGPGTSPPADRTARTGTSVIVAVVIGVAAITAGSAIRLAGRRVARRRRSEGRLRSGDGCDGDHGGGGDLGG